jgi:hydroxymethylpyrimidine pyrophosphatase-like HAD family hydrolase
MKHAHWIATDLDGTLIGRLRHENSLPATWVTAPDASPAPSSWIPQSTHSLMSALAQVFGIVPVTARDLASFRRVAIKTLPFSQGAIVANGAILLRPDSMIPDEEHDAQVEAILVQWKEILCDIIERVHSLELGDGVRARLVSSNVDAPAYMVVKADESFWPSDLGQNILEILQTAGLRTAHFGREVQAVPPGLSKRLGVEAFARRFRDGALPVLALGDTNEDLGFLELAEFMAMPRVSQLAERLNGDKP